MSGDNRGKSTPGRSSMNSKHGVPKPSGKSDLAEAMRYTLSRSDTPTRFLHDGSVEIDNNAAERSIRAIASVARTTSLPLLSTRSSKLPSLNGIDSEAYLLDVLARIADHKINRIGDAAAVELGGYARAGKSRVVRRMLTEFPGGPTF